MVNARPYEILGIEPTASAEATRHRYLELVRQYPPDREPERFREIHAAYQAFTDPLVQAESLLNQDALPRPWDEVIEEAQQHPPRLPVDVLLALGNAPSESEDKDQGSV